MARILYTPTKSNSNFRKVVSPIKIRYPASNPSIHLPKSAKRAIPRSSVDHVAQTLPVTESNAIKQRKPPGQQKNTSPSQPLDSSLDVVKDASSQEDSPISYSPETRSIDNATKNESKVNIRKIQARDGIHSAQYRLHQFELATTLVNYRYQSILQNISSIIESETERKRQIQWRRTRQEVDDSAGDIKYHMHVCRQLIILRNFNDKCLNILEDDTVESERKRTVACQLSRAIHYQRTSLMVDEYRFHTASTWRKYCLLRLHHAGKFYYQAIHRIWELSDEVTRPLGGLVECLDILNGNSVNREVGGATSTKLDI